MGKAMLNGKSQHRSIREALRGHIVAPTLCLEKFQRTSNCLSSVTTTTTNLRHQLPACYANEDMEEAETSGATTTEQTHLSAYFFPLSSSGPSLQTARNEAITNKIARFLHKDTRLINADSLDSSRFVQICIFNT